MNTYLWEFAQKLPSENLFQVILKSALSVAASYHADVGKTNNKWMCHKCKTLWMHGYFHVDEVAGTDRYDKIIEKYQNKTIRSKKQQAYLDYLTSRKHTTVKYTCKLCSNQTRITTDKSCHKPNASTSNLDVVCPPVIVSSKKKKRKKDPTAGLTISLETKRSVPNVTKKNKKLFSFSSKEPSKLNALANMLKKKSEGLSSAGSSSAQERLKLLLK
ncbi:uncharacterized protein LOC134212162 [Armigeres subalbatus]|uniref:uncharacterized protein LOC134212162 n=1 Tax=Armigeres subalbatus TaxID=124917 RepID=UPI002ECFBF7A